MSIADKLTALSAVKATPFAGWPGLISSIPAGGVDAPTGLIDGTATTLDLSAWPVTGALRPYAFTSCTKLTSITLPAGMTGSIGTNAFSNCSSLTSLTLPAGMTGSIGTNAFSNCSSLTSLTLPAGVTSIGTQAFYGSTLRQLVIKRTAGVVTLANVDAFGNSGITATTGDIYVPDALVGTYKTAANWVTFAYRIQPLSAYTP